MDKVTRIGVSLEPALLDAFDSQISEKGYSSRSEALRALVRDSLAENEWKNETANMKGVLVAVYDSTVLGVNDRMAAFVHSKGDMVLFTTEFALGNNTVMVLIVAQGTFGDLRKMADDIMTVRGMHRGRLSMASSDSGNMHHIGIRK